MPSRRASRWSALVLSVARRRLALALAPAIALFGVLVAPAMPVQAAYVCHYSDKRTSVTVKDPGGKFILHGQEYAGHYRGSTVVPSTTSVSAAGIEAQCLLRRAGYNPGTIDGIFGTHSQAAVKRLQSFVNRLHKAKISVDGLPGPHTWPWLRYLGQNRPQPSPSPLPSPSALLK